MLSSITTRPLDRTTAMTPRRNLGQSRSSTSILRLSPRRNLWCSQTGEFDGGVVTKFEDRPERQDFKIQTSRHYVFTEIAEGQLVAVHPQRFEKLGSDQMNLTQIRLSGPEPGQMSMTDERAGMDISLDY